MEWNSRESLNIWLASAYYASRDLCDHQACTHCLGYYGFEESLCYSVKCLKREKLYRGLKVEIVTFRAL